MKQWTCVCGAVNAGKYCDGCGASMKEMIRAGVVKDDNEPEETADANDQEPKKTSPSEHGSIEIGAATNTTRTQPTTSLEPPKSKPQDAKTASYTETISQAQTIESAPRMPGASQQQSTNISHGIDNSGVRTGMSFPAKYIGIVAVLLVLCFGCGYYMSSSMNDTTKPVVKKTVSTDQKKTDSVEKTVKETTPEKKTVKAISVRDNQTSELSFEGINIGDDFSAAKSWFGKAKSISKEGKYTRYKYELLDVVVLNGKIIAMVSNSDRVVTKRGFREGDRMEDVLKTYGNSDMKYQDGNLLVYEYKFPSNGMGDGLIRYAFDKNTKLIEYISIRIPDEWL